MTFFLGNKTKDYFSVSDHITSAKDQFEDLFDLQGESMSLKKDYYVYDEASYQVELGNHITKEVLERSSFNNVSLIQGHTLLEL